MTLRIENAKLGTMIQVAEVSQLTGIPVGTIRLWRQEKYKHLRKFKTYDQHGTRAKWYRLDDVNAWLAVNVKPDSFDGFSADDDSDGPNVIEAPINASATPYDGKRIEAINYAKKITRNNHKEIMAKLIKPFDNPGVVKIDFATKHIEALTNAWFNGEEPVPFTNFFPAKQLNGMFPSFRDDPIPEERERAHFILANLTRLLDAELNGRELSVEDAVAIPL
jgi:hypothetical protein